MVRCRNLKTGIRTVVIFLSVEWPPLWLRLSPPNFYAAGANDGHHSTIGPGAGHRALTGATRMTG